MAFRPARSKVRMACGAKLVIASLIGGDIPQTPIDDYRSAATHVARQMDRHGGTADLEKIAWLQLAGAAIRQAISVNSLVSSNQSTKYLVGIAVVNFSSSIAMEEFTSENSSRAISR